MTFEAATFNWESLAILGVVCALMARFGLRPLGAPRAGASPRVPQALEETLLVLQLLVGFLVVAAVGLGASHDLILRLGLAFLATVALWSLSLRRLCRLGPTDPLRRATVILILVPGALGWVTYTLALNSFLVIGMLPMLAAAGLLWVAVLRRLARWVTDVPRGAGAARVVGWAGLAVAALGLQVAVMAPIRWGDLLDEKATIMRFQHKLRGEADVAGIQAWLQRLPAEPGAADWSPVDPVRWPQTVRSLRPPAVELKGNAAVRLLWFHRDTTLAFVVKASGTASAETPESIRRRQQGQEHRRPLGDAAYVAVW